MAETCNKNKLDTQHQQRRELEILPLEIWDMVFKGVKSSKDLEACCKVSQSWKEILNPRRAEWMMEMVFPLIAYCLPKKEILSYRLVCRRWCRAVDSHLTKDQDYKLEKKIPIGQIGYQFPRKFFQTDFGPWRGNELAVVKFMKDMRNHYKNPFIGRSLRVCVRHGSQVFLEFLRKFGHFLESLEIYFEFTERGVHPSTHTLPRVKYICACLEQVQNLKRLSLFYSIYEGPLRNLLLHTVPNKAVDETVVKEYFKSHVVPIPPGIQKIGYVLETLYDGGAFEAAFKRDMSNQKRRIWYTRESRIRNEYYDEVENWDIKRFCLLGFC